jgi:hypothetical protein
MRRVMCCWWAAGVGEVYGVGAAGVGGSAAIEGTIPVLVELRYWQGSIVDLIQAFLGRHEVWLDQAEVKQLLRDRRLLLCVDGLNELPSEAGRQDVARLRRDFPQVAMIFTTRDLSVGGDFGIEKKLEMQALTNRRCRRLCDRTYRAGRDDAAAVGRSAAGVWANAVAAVDAVWVVSAVWADSDELGGVFRAFTQGYERNLKGDVVRGRSALVGGVVAGVGGGDDAGRGGGAEVEFRVAIGKAEVCSIFAEFLEDKEAQPAGAARKCLEDLLKHHLIQASGEQVEFRHQLIQEYYAAEWLLERVGGLGDGELKQEFLNFSSGRSLWR